MNFDTDPRAGFERGDGDALLRRLLGELSSGRESAPDLTDAVMARLGFVRCSAQEARRARRRRLAGRLAVLALVVLAACGGYVLATTRDSGTPMAIPAVVGGVVERKGRSLEALIDGLPRLQSIPMATPASLTTPMPLGRMPGFRARDSMDFRFEHPSAGAMPVLFIPVPVDCSPRREAQPARPQQECPALRRAAAVVPYPQT